MLSCAPLRFLSSRTAWSPLYLDVKYVCLVPQVPTMGCLRLTLSLAFSLSLSLSLSLPHPTPSKEEIRAKERRAETWDQYALLDDLADVGGQRKMSLLMPLEKGLGGEAEGPAEGNT